jgi:putative membrane protein
MTLTGAPVADTRRWFWYWFWPPPPIARRLWLVVAASTAYAAAVYWFCDLFPFGQSIWAGELAALNAVVLGVLIGFRTKAAYDRWWEGRIQWGQLTNHSRNLCLKAAALADPPPEDRRELLRLVAGFPVALMRHLRGRVALQDVPGFEKDPATPAHVPAELAGRVFALVAAWRRSGRIDGHAQQLLDPHAAALMDVCGACERIRNTPLPGSYLSLLRHGLVLGLLLLPWQLAVLLGVWEVPVQALAIYFLVGIELIAEEVEQPFGLDGDDLPLERYCATIRANAGEILAA